jgi:hypothetical protein
MTGDAKEVLQQFDRLSALDQREVAAAILRRLTSGEVPPLSDEELLGAADQLFLALDESEAKDGHDISAR